MSRCDRCPLRPSQKLVYPVTCFCGHVLVAGEESTPRKTDLKEQRQRIHGRPDLRLGDFTESRLKAIGITPERYKAAKELFGLAPTCDCEKRKQWLNAVSDWWSNESRDQSSNSSDS